jgi:hypothetical protein
VDTAVSANAIVSGDVLWQKNQQLNAVARGIDLVRLSPQQRENIGNPLSVQEQTLYSGVADFVTRFAPQLLRLGFNVGHVGQSFDVDLCLQQCEESNNQVMTVSHDGVFILTGAMTESDATVEKAAQDLKADPATSTLVKLNIDSAMAPVTDLRETNAKQALKRQQNTRKLSSERTAELTGAQNRQTVAILASQMAKAPLPAVSPLPGMRVRGKKKTGRSTGKAKSKGTTAIRHKKSPTDPTKK